MKDVYVLVFDGLADWEIGLITFELSTRNNITVTTVGFTGEPIETGGSLRVLPDVVLSEIDLDGVGLLILPGRGMWHDVFPQDLAQVIARLHGMGVPVAAICGATVFLAKAGLFKGVLHTSNALEYLQQFAPEYDAQDFYRDVYAASDKGVITAGGLASVEFTYQILKTLQVYDDEVLSEFAEFWSCRGTW
ncbi:MAG: DJ-1/PfpI family protein [Anaerolineae bacterium]|nr:DJ-1/PfpI family protein [Anaerolineae bacterium]